MKGAMNMWGRTGSKRERKRVYKTEPKGERTLNRGTLILLNNFLKTATKQKPLLIYKTFSN